MIAFKKYFLEYYKGNPVTNPNYGVTSKRVNVDPSIRKHSNAVKQEFKHKHPIVDSICLGKSNNVKVAGQPLLQILTLYSTQFEPGIKTLGNSDVEVEMYEDEENGHQVGILRNKKKSINVL